jgi:hypothetical protein
VDRQQLTESVTQMFQGHEPEITQGSEYSLIRVPFVPKSQVRFVIYIYADSEPELGAESCGGSIAGSGDRRIWSMHFERAGFRTNDEMQEAFLASLRVLLTHRTRIILSEGRVLRGSTCQYWSADRWEPLGGSSSLKSTDIFRAPDSPEVIFLGEPLFPNVSSGPT